MPGHADVPLPQRVLNPITDAEAWNVLRLSTTNVGRLLHDGRVEEVPDQISLCSPALRVIARVPVKGVSQEARDAQISVAFRSVNLIAQDGMVGNLDGAKMVFAEFQRSLKALSVGFAPQMVDGEIYCCLNHPEVIASAKGKVCEKCQRPLVARRIPYSFVFVEPEHATAALIAAVDHPLQAGIESTVKLHLTTTSGSPLDREDLITVHTQPIHALLLGPQFADFQWKQPQPTANPGEYSFAFTPEKDGAYWVWAGVVPAATGLQEYPQAHLGAVDSVPVVPEPTTVSATVGDLRFQLLPSSGRTVVFKERQLQLIRLRVSGSGGRPLQSLEPFLNAFAHLTGVYADGQQVVQFHPTGGDVLGSEVRGGPELSFKVFWPKAGFLKLFCVAKVNGHTVTAPFNINVVK
ncbi:MAG: hypothetical protein H7A55_13755 [Verrucomicrobiaceae bacterium]|nr:hypothetical protein [Verrucomicrobiaceae bacterium]